MPEDLTDDKPASVQAIAWCNQLTISYTTRYILLVTGPRSYIDDFNTLRPTQDGRYFTDGVLKCIFLNENVWISLKIPLKFVPMGPINNIPALVQIMAWRRPGDKPLSEPMLVFVPTHISVTQPQWVNIVAFPLKNCGLEVPNDNTVSATIMIWL